MHSLKKILLSPTEHLNLISPGWCFSYLLDIIQSYKATPSPTTVPLKRPPVCSSLKIIHRSFQTSDVTPRFWIVEYSSKRLGQAAIHLALTSLSDLKVRALSTSRFHSKIETRLFHIIYISACLDVPSQFSSSSYPTSTFHQIHLMVTFISSPHPQWSTY